MGLVLLCLKLDEVLRGSAQLPHIFQYESSGSEFRLEISTCVEVGSSNAKFEYAELCGILC